MPERNPISVQLYTLRDAVAADYLGTLRAVAELGYRAVELVTLGSMSARELRSELDLLGLQACSAHVGLNRLTGELDTVLDELQELGARYAICPWIGPEMRGSADSYRSLANTLNDIGRKCAERGRQLCYHNHDFEFAPLDGTNGFDILFGESDQELVKSELDVYWVAKAGHDPVALIQQLGKRVPLVHLKDMANTAEQEFAEVGQGVLDFPAILAACDAAGVDWMVVEQDVCKRPPLESIGMSLDYLRSIGRS